MADKKWSVFPTSTTADVGDLFSFIDISEPDATKNRVITKANLRATLGSSVWDDDGVDVKTDNDPRNVNLQGGGLKSDFVTTLIPFGNANNTRYHISPNNIVGAVNETLSKCAASAGIISGGIFVDNGGTLDVSSGTGFLRETDIDNGIIHEILWLDSIGNVILPDTIRYVGVEYNAGSPQVIIKTTDTWDNHTEFSLGNVVNDSGTLHLSYNPTITANGISHTQQRFYETLPLIRAERIGGIILGETGIRNVTVSAGELFDRFNEFVIAAIDTSVADTFDTYLGLTLANAGMTQWDNDNYNNGGVKTSLSANKYANLWFYIETDGHLVMVYGTAQYNTSTSAENETVPSTIPLRITAHGRLIGRIIFQKGAATAVLIESAFTTVFEPTLASDHTQLSNLTTSDAGHTQFAVLTGRSGGQVIDGGTLTTKTLGLRNNAVDDLGFDILALGVLRSNIANYETLILNDNDIVNKKYVDDHEGNGMWTRTVTTLSPTNAGDDVQVPGSLITIGNGAATETLLTFAPNGASSNNATIKGTTVGTQTVISFLTGGSTTMIIDEIGLVTKPFQCAFFAYNSAVDSNATGDGTQISPTEFNIELFDQNNDYNTTTDSFTTAKTGKYYFKVSLSLSGLLSTHTAALLQFVTSNNVFQKFQNSANTRDANNNLILEDSFFVEMDAGDIAFVTIKISNGTKVVGIGGTVSNHFAGYLVV